MPSVQAVLAQSRLEARVKLAGIVCYCRYQQFISIGYGLRLLAQRNLRERRTAYE